MQNVILYYVNNFVHVIICTNRTNGVRYQGTLLTWQQMRAGVPQCTLLGPLNVLGKSVGG